MRLVELMKNEEWMILDGTGIVLVMHCTDYGTIM